MFYMINRAVGSLEICKDTNKIDVNIKMNK